MIEEQISIKIFHANYNVSDEIDIATRFTYKFNEVFHFFRFNLRHRVGRSTFTFVNSRCSKYVNFSNDSVGQE